MSDSTDHAVAMHGWNSACALVCCCVAWFASLGGIAGGLILYARDNVPPLQLFRYFTTITNFITALGASTLFPFAVEGLRRRHFSCPRWATMFFYSGTICSTLTMLIATTAISRFSPQAAFGGYNLYLHIICPLLTITTFYLVESDSHYRMRDSIVCMSPVVVYACAYIYKAMYVGSDRGGWEDMYQIETYTQPAISIVLGVLLAFGLAQLIRISHRRLCDYRLRRFVRTHLPEDLSEVDIRLSVLELGEEIGRHEDENFVVLPLKSLSLLANRYSLRREELAEVYVRALVDTMDERHMADPSSDEGPDDAEDDRR